MLYSCLYPYGNSGHQRVARTEYRSKKRTHVSCLLTSTVRILTPRTLPTSCEWSPSRTTMTTSRSSSSCCSTTTRRVHTAPLAVLSVHGPWLCWTPWYQTNATSALVGRAGGVGVEGGWGGGRRQKRLKCWEECLSLHAWVNSSCVFNDHKSTASVSPPGDGN